jgi:2'-5' RNA ligase
VKGLKVFETSGTLYLETDYPEELKKIRKELYIKNKQLRISKQFYSLISTPHITIGRGLKKDSLIKLEDYMSKRVCDKEFYVKDLLGLRADSRDVKYQKRFSFKLKE